MTYTESANCPESHPYPFNRGQSCCRFGIEGYCGGISTQGMALTFDSTCCFSASEIPCPNDGGCTGVGHVESKPYRTTFTKNN